MISPQMSILIQLNMSVEIGAVMSKSKIVFVEIFNKLDPMSILFVFPMKEPYKLCKSRNNNLPVVILKAKLSWYFNAKLP